MKYRDIKKYRWQVLTDEHYDLPYDLQFDAETDWITLKGKSLDIFKGYAWNGANRPAINTKNFRIPSLVHDAICQLIRIGLLPVTMWDTAGDIMHYYCLRCGMSEFRANYCRWAVNTFGDRRLALGTPQDQIYEINLPVST